jgi:hypothetical protein
LFVYAVRRAGVAEIVEGIRRVGWGLAIILGLAGLRFMLRAECWRLCLPPHARLTFPHALSAFLAGDAVGSVTPLGLLASEPTKVLLIRHHLATRESVASLAVENLVYGVSVVAVTAVGLVVAVAIIPLAVAWQAAAAAVLLSVVGGAALGIRLLRGTWDSQKGPRPRWREPLARIRAEVVGFSAAHYTRLWTALALDLLFHALAVTEVFLTLGWLLGDASPSVTQAIVFEAMNRVVTVVFKFVPFRIGVDEAVSGALAPLLAVSASAGVTLAVVRKVRNLFWGAIGLALVAAHPARR